MFTADRLESDESSVVVSSIHVSMETVVTTVNSSRDLRSLSGQVGDNRITARVTSFIFGVHFKTRFLLC